MRVLHLVKTSTGATWALRQMQALAKLGVEVHVALPANGPLTEQYTNGGVVVHDHQFALPTDRPHRWLGLRRDLNRLVQALRPDLIHSHHLQTTISARLALGRRHDVPRLFQVPGPLHLENPLFRRAELATAGQPDWWLGPSHYTCDLYRRAGADPGRVLRTNPGFDLDAVSPRDPQVLRRELRLSPGTKVVGMVAFMYPPKRYLGQQRGLKGHEDLIDAVALARRHHPDLVLVIVGGAWGGARSHEAHVRRYGGSVLGSSCVFLGTRSDVFDLYAGMDVAVHPSHSENFGGAAESLLLGIPTVATAVGAFPELVRPGETGWLVSPNRPDCLAQAILDAVNNPTTAQRMAQRGKTVARDMLDVVSNTQTLLDSYEWIAHRSKPAAPTSDSLVPGSSHV